MIKKCARLSCEAEFETAKADRLYCHSRECQAARSREAHHKWSIKNRKYKADYQREWKKRNPEKVKRTARAYYLNNQEKVREYQRRWYAANPQIKIKSIRKSRQKAVTSELATLLFFATLKAQEKI